MSQVTIKDIFILIAITQGLQIGQLFLIMGNSG